MLQADAAIIGGTGIGERLGEMPGRAFLIPTKFGPMRGRLIERDGCRLAAIQRHAAGHKLLPHQVRYEAIALGLKRMSVRAAFSSAAVGSVNPDFGIGTLVACRDFLDLTPRATTIHTRKVLHDDMTNPFPARRHLPDLPEGVYVATNGPRYESPAEIEMIRRIGGDLVGMTASSEAIAMAEAGVPYACLAVVTNLAAGMSDSQLHHGEVTDVMKTQGGKALDLLLSAACKA